MALCGMEYVKLKRKTIKILRTYFPYNRSLENDENYRRYIIRIKKTVEIEENATANN